METLAYVREKGGKKNPQTEEIKEESRLRLGYRGFPPPPQDRVLLAEGWEPGEGHLQLLLGTVQWCTKGTSPTLCDSFR